jgi:transposase
MTQQKKSPKYSPELRERAVRMVLDNAREYSSQWAAIETIAGKLHRQRAQHHRST